MILRIYRFSRCWGYPVPAKFGANTTEDEQKCCRMFWRLPGQNSPAGPLAGDRHRGGGKRGRRERRQRLRLSWKVRYRTFLWFFSQMIKLYRARSLLYRRQILQENIRWKALDEIYKIYMLLHRSDLNISENFRQFFSHFMAKICKNSLFWILFIDFCSDFDEILSEFRR